MINVNSRTGWIFAYYPQHSQAKQIKKPVILRAKIFALANADKAT